MIKAIVFDMDDTLYKEYDFVFGGFKAVSIYISDKYNLSENDIYQKILEIFYSEGRGKIFNRIVDKYNLDEDISTLVNIYRFYEPKIELYSDAKEIIKWCRENKIKTGIITDGMSKVQWNKITALGLDKIIDKIIVTDDYGREFWKPHIRAYEDIINYFGFKGNEVIYIGDNPNKDFEGAKKKGMITIQMIREKSDYINYINNEEIDEKIHDFYVMKNLCNKFK